MTAINSVIPNNPTSIHCLPVKEYAQLIYKFLEQFDVDLDEAEFLLIDGLEVPLQIGFCKKLEEVELKGTVIGFVSEDQQFINYEIWQSFETEQFALQFELINDTETVSLYSFATENLELRMLQTDNKIMHLKIFDQTNCEKLLFGMQRDTNCLNGQMPIFKRVN